MSEREAAGGVAHEVCAAGTEKGSAAGGSEAASGASGGAGGELGGSFVIQEFRRQLVHDEVPVQVAAIRALTEVIRSSEESTGHGLLIEIKAAADELKQCPRELLRGKTAISISAACEILVRFVTRTNRFDTHKRFEDFRSTLVERGETFLDVSMRSRARVAELGQSFIRDGTVVMTHGHSLVVEKALLRAARSKHFSVVVTEGRATGSGALVAAKMAAAGIPCTIVLDAAMGYVMERVDMVIVGAEGVVENGGIISTVGTYQLAITASALKTPVYVAAESYKFTRLFPLSQAEVQERLRSKLEATDVGLKSLPESATFDSPSCDYTPPQYLTLLFTDLGILTPSAVSDELIKLYA